MVKVYTPVGGMANVGKPLIDIRKPASATSTPSTSADAASASSLSAPQPASQGGAAVDLIFYQHGAVRIDYFWGAGDTAEQQAGRMKQPLRAWVLVPKT